MSERLVTEWELAGLLVRLGKLERRISAVEVIEKLTYTTGTYVPTYLGATTPGTTTYTTQDGFYVRLGALVFFHGRVIWTAATGTGSAIVSLPFTAQNTTGMRSIAVVYPTNVTFANGSIAAQIAPNTAFFVMNSPATNAAGTAVAVEAAGDIIFGGLFEA